MKKWILLTFIILLILTGCGKKEESNQNDMTPPTPLSVAFTFTPEKMEPNSPVTIQATITQGEDLVEDATEVKFEIWRKGVDQHEMLDPTNKGNGVYSLDKTFMDEGTYYVIAHVTARGLHSMPKQEFLVGNAEQPVKQSEGTTDTEQSQQDEGTTSTEDHHDTNLTIDLTPTEGLEINKDSTFTATIMEEDAALTEAVVQFEIWQGHDEKHDYIKATENKPGEYIATTNFSTQGMYSLKVHVEKGEIHDHKEFMLEVK